MDLSQVSITETNINGYEGIELRHEDCDEVFARFRVDRSVQLSELLDAADDHECE